MRLIQAAPFSYTKKKSRKSSSNYREILTKVVSDLNDPGLNSCQTEDMIFYLGAFIYDKDVVKRISTFHPTALSDESAVERIGQIADIRK